MTDSDPLAYDYIRNVTCGQLAIEADVILMKVSWYNYSWRNFIENNFSWQVCCVPLKVLQLQTSTAPPPTAPRIITSTSAPKTTAATKPELRSATVASITRAPAPAPAVTKVRDLAYTCGTSNVVHGAPTPAMRGEEAPLGNPETHGPQSSAFYSIGLHRLRRNDCFPTEIVDNLTRSYRTLFLDGCNYHFSFYSIYEKKRRLALAGSFGLPNGYYGPYFIPVQRCPGYQSTCGGCCPLSLSAQ